MAAGYRLDRPSIDALRQVLRDRQQLPRTPAGLLRDPAASGREQRDPRPLVQIARVISNTSPAALGLGKWWGRLCKRTTYTVTPDASQLDMTTLFADAADEDVLILVPHEVPLGRRLRVSDYVAVDPWPDTATNGTTTWRVFVIRQDWQPAIQDLAYNTSAKRLWVTYDGATQSDRIQFVTCTSSRVTGSGATGIVGAGQDRLGLSRAFASRDPDESGISR